MIVSTILVPVPAVALVLEYVSGNSGKNDSNDIVWTFNHNGVFDLTSTEYSGPAQYSHDGKKDLMFVKNFIEVVGCKGDNK